MVKVEYRCDTSGGLLLLRCQGHAFFDNEGGGDIVCAAVSALTGALGLGLTEGRDGPYPVQADHGFFELKWLAPPCSEDRFLAQTILKALLQMQQHYPGFIRVRQLPGS